MITPTACRQDQQTTTKFRLDNDYTYIVQTATKSWLDNKCSSSVQTTPTDNNKNVRTTTKSRLDNNIQTVPKHQQLQTTPIVF